MKIRMQTRKELADDYDSKHLKPIRPERMWRRRGKYDDFLEGVQGWSVSFRTKCDEEGIPTKAGAIWMEEKIKHDTAKLAWVKEQVKKQIEEAGVQTLDDEIVDVCYNDGGEYEIDDYRMMRAITTQEQKDWLIEHALTMDKLFEGGYKCSDEKEVHEVFFRPWNKILKANGLGAQFIEEPFCEAMMESIKENLGPDITSVEFVDDKPEEEVFGPKLSVE